MTSDARAAFDAGDDGFHEIQLNGKQLVFLGMATTLVSVVIFLCGVLVGRGVKPIDTVAQAAGPQAFEAPASPAVTVPPGTVSTPAPAPTPGPTHSAAAAAAAPGEDDTQPTPVGDDPEAAPGESTHPAPAPAPAAAKPAVEPPAAKPMTKPEAPKPTPKPAQVAVVPPPVKPTPAPAPAPAPALAATAPAAATSSTGAIAVQVGAFKTRGEADALAKRLSGKGYAVYVMNPLGDGKAVYRVRVGNYGTADEAKSVSARLTQQEKLKPWITR